VKFYQTNLTGFEVRGGLATKEKTFIGFRAIKQAEKLEYERIDVSNFEKIKKSNDGCFKVYKNDIVFFVFDKENFRGGKIVSFLEDKKMAAFSNPKYPANIQAQPESFLTMFKGKANSHKQVSIGKAKGIVKLKVDILGNIESYQVLGDVKSKLLDEIKSIVSH
jgi:hypothetical protein